jgi:NAD(P)-dependent dehydrogenase (short-subunit alcohol dehydrogenase family)
MDIVITGANGVVGTALIRHLHAGAPLGTVRLRALVRSLARAQSLPELGAEIIVVDYRRPETLREAVAGADVVVHLAGALLPRRGESLLQANVDATRALVEAAASVGVKTCVYLSFPGADPVSKNQYLGSAGRLCRCHLAGADDPRATKRSGAAAPPDGQGAVPASGRRWCGPPPTHCRGRCACRHRLGLHRGAQASPCSESGWPRDADLCRIAPPGR